MNIPIRISFALLEMRAAIAYIRNCGERMSANMPAQERLSVLWSCGPGNEIGVVLPRASEMSEDEAVEALLGEIEILGLMGKDNECVVLVQVHRATQAEKCATLVARNFARDVIVQKREDQMIVVGGIGQRFEPVHL